MRFIDRLVRSSVLLAALSLLFGLSILTEPARADRPGTPNEVKLNWCPEDNSKAPRICGGFHNTAPESVLIEMEFTKDGQPAKADKMGCGQATQSPASAVCWTRNYLKEGFDRTKELRFDIRDLEFGAQYCTRFRARRTTDQMVSEQWSAWACAKTPVRPAGPPVAPQFKIDFTDNSHYCRKRDIIEVTHLSFEEYSELRTTVSAATGPDSGVTGVTEYNAMYYKPHIAKQGMAPDCVEAILENTWVYVEVCSYNVAGKSCSHKVASAAAKVVLDPPPPNQKAFKLTGAPRDPTFQPDVNLAGMDYRNQPMVGNNDPQACQAMCNAEDVCKAWTWVKPAVQGPHAVCWLKRAVPPRAWGMYTTSGVKAGGIATTPPPAQPPANTNPPASVPSSANAQPATNPPPASGQSGILTGVDMPGKDYRRVDLNAGAAPAACQSLCAQEAPCKAWTWVRYNPQTAKPACWLKNDVPLRVANPDVASGLKGSASGSGSRPDFRRRVQ
ncbi:PAN domain-containing protein [Bradyrhizobium sp. MOS003]|uniref:PAN domain-containing protein n=1 Tax=Bradyrhizobium sp. MOS003 TaxID=2133946 RepID=UPI000D12FD72|nr:PAN domain-containing protein [Bradyrhizobium sp. MOS003]PSO17378.1 hypothetical protein C7G42_21720 [Bradyrhizobium sp. MOS003]